jgi:hypothetical protein
MRLDSSGTLFLQTRLNTPAITLGVTDLSTVLGEKANTASPSFTGTVSAPGVTINSSSTSFSNLVAFTGGTSGLSKSSVGLDNVDNTSDLNKPISTATQTALNGKANLSGATFTGTVTIPTLTGVTAPTFTGDIVVNKTGDNSVNIRSETGSSSLYLQTNNLSNNLRMFYNSSGLFQFRQNNTALGGTGGVGVSAFEVYPNGVLTTGNKVNNKTFVLFENGSSSDDPITATNFYGLGYNSGLLRYQTPFSGNSHKFFTGLVESLSVNGTDMYFGDPSGSAVYPNPTMNTKRLTIDCPVSGGTPYLTMKSRNQATAEVALTNATWLFASKTNNLNIVFQTLNNAGTTSNVMTMTGSTGAVTFLNNIIVNGTTVTSDRTLKDNIQDVNVDDCLHIFNNLKVKSFDWKRTGRPSLGFIAQEVEEILPLSNNYDIVSESEYQPTPDDEPMMIKTVDYTKLNTMLYVVIKEQQKRIDSLETKLANIEKLLSSPMNI